jgi:hypothetical protein
MLDYPGGPEQFKSDVERNNKAAVSVRDWPADELGIRHNFFCGCQWIEHGSGDQPLRQCSEHLGRDIWPDKRLPDWADLFAMQVLGDWIQAHVRADG